MVFVNGKIVWTSVATDDAMAERMGGWTKSVARASGYGGALGFWRMKRAGSGGGKMQEGGGWKHGTRYC